MARRYRSEKRVLEHMKYQREEEKRGRKPMFRKLKDDFVQFNRPMDKVKCIQVLPEAQVYKSLPKKGKQRQVYILRGFQMAKDVQVGDKGIMYYRSTEDWGLYFFIPRNLRKSSYYWDLQEQLDRTTETVIEEYDARKERALKRS